MQGASCKQQKAQSIPGPVCFGKSSVRQGGQGARLPFAELSKGVEGVEAV